MFASSIHLDISLTVLDNSGQECLASYSRNTTPLLYLFCRFYDIFVSIYWLLKPPLCGVSGVLKVISDFMSSLNSWVILVIISGWEILRVILVRSRWIVNPKKSFSWPIDWVVYYLLMHSIVSINDGLSLIASVSSTYTVKIKVPT